MRAMLGSSGADVLQRAGSKLLDEIHLAVPQQSAQIAKLMALERHRPGGRFHGKRLSPTPSIPVM